MSEFLLRIRLLICMLALLLVASPALALPGDYDMYRQQSLKSNEVARSPVAGTVPRGRMPFTYTLEEGEKNLKNPVAKDMHSVWRGQRLWNANCWTCHGKVGDGKGPVGPQIGVPSLLTDYYSGTSDGRVFSVIQLGLRNMPRYGFRFSDKEQWDLVNYLRFLQGTFDVPEIQRPDAVEVKDK
jgi:mono/diheme cytochrome c family protein